MGAAYCCLILLTLIFSVAAKSKTRLSKERLVFQTEFGDIEMAFYPEVAPATSQHILKLAELGAYDTNEFFRVDRGFVAQVQSCESGRKVPLNSEQMAEAKLRFPLEVVQGVKHITGVLSMGRTSDPNSNGSSFSILLGSAPHLDMNYTIFGEVVAGMDTLRKMELVETRREGIFVMPKERITILSSYVKFSSGEDPICTTQLELLEKRFVAQEEELMAVRSKCLPGN